MRQFIIILAVVWATLAPAEQVPQSAAQMQLSFVPVVKQAAPAVVNIYAKIIREAQRSPFQGDPFFERFFRDFGAERPRVQNSLGSGVILTEDGIIVSNYHVVGNATDIRVVLNDRREYEARVLLGDAESDLAILQLEAVSGLPHLTLRSSDTVEVGELVLAIGNPFGVGQTVSSGIVSGLARSGTASGSSRGYFIQTDAPINPGNSGGALVDVNGKLVGINTSILSRSGGSNGIGFAIPADLVANFVAQAQAGRTAFAPPWAGMRGQAVDADMAEAFGLDFPQGVIVSYLHPESSFAQAGLQAGDVVLSVNETAIFTPPEMIYRMSVAGIGQIAEVEVLRRGEAQRHKVEMIEAPDTPARDALILDRAAVLEGLHIARINPAVMAELNLSLNATGVVVLETSRLGRRVGLQERDVIEQINDVPMEHPRDVYESLAARSPVYSVTVLRGNSRIVLQFRV